MTGQENQSADQETQEFADLVGYGAVDLVRLAHDASARRYWRISGTGTLIADDRDAPETMERFVWLARHLQTLGLRVPEIFQYAPGSGFALIEDLGDDTYDRLLVEGADWGALYGKAGDALLALHKRPDATQTDLPRQNSARLLRELGPYLDNYAPEITGRFVNEAERDRFRELWTHLLSPVDQGSKTLVLRDVHAGNLILVPSENGTNCAFIDFQDALIGAPEYDFVSLLQDARRDLPDGLEDALLQNWIGEGIEAQHRYAILGAQRHARLLGLFVRLWREGNKQGYLRYIPRVQRQLKTALSMACATDILRCLDDITPGWDSAQFPIENSV